MADAGTVLPGDVRYGDLSRGENLRFTGRPERIHPVSSTEQVVEAVGAAVREGKRIAVRSGGHCYEDFVTDPGVQVVIDMTGMSAVGYDARRHAFAVEAGATLGQVYKQLFRRWGVTIPGGACPEVAAGGHILGGGYGPLSRLHGSVVDYLYGVEVVVVDASGAVRSVVATRDPADPNRDLWWAHTGGGGGNFGVVVRYWLRSAQGDALIAAGRDRPELLLPRPPAEMLIRSTGFPWPHLDRAAFTRLVGNYGAWLEEHSAPDSPYTGMFGFLALPRAEAGAVLLVARMDSSVPDAARLLDQCLAAVTEGVRAPSFARTGTLPWLHSTRWPVVPGDDMIGRNKIKAAYMRRGFSTAQTEAMHHHLTRPGYHNPGSVIALVAYGGRVNAVAPHATAVPQRDSVLKAAYTTTWQDPAEDDTHIGWVRELYRDVYADTGGVPVPGGAGDGSYINYPDTDLADPDWNTSGVPWHELYYKDAYPRLQQAKARWDPRDVFRHALSVRLPAPGAPHAG
jgi:FAD binding domain/Berberine and berberine like